MQRILLVEDQTDYQLTVKTLLSGRFEVLVAGTAKEALDLAQREKVDLVLLDVSLPDGNGFRLVVELKALPGFDGVPVVFLTGHSEVSDRVAGFSLGADDYIVKPFEPLEFRARIEAKLQAKQAREAGALLRRGRISVDRVRYKGYVTSKDGAQVDLQLTPHELRLLVHLITHEDEVMTRDQLIDAVWGRDIHVLERTVDRHISALRKKLGKGSERIESVHGVGYRFSLDPKAKVSNAA